MTRGENMEHDVERGRSQTKAEGILEGSKITGYEIESLGCT